MSKFFKGAAIGFGLAIILWSLIMLLGYLGSLIF